METFFHNGTLDANGSPVSRLRYTAFGETRYVNGATPTDYRYTGGTALPKDAGTVRRSVSGVINEAEPDLYLTNARRYDPLLGRFVQPDSMVPYPGNPPGILPISSCAGKCDCSHKSSL